MLRTLLSPCLPILCLVAPLFVSVSSLASEVTEDPADETVSLETEQQSSDESRLPLAGITPIYPGV